MRTLVRISDMADHIIAHPRPTPSPIAPTQAHAAHAPLAPTVRAVADAYAQPQAAPRGAGAHVPHGATPTPGVPGAKVETEGSLQRMALSLVTQAHNQNELRHLADSAHLKLDDVVSAYVQHHFRATEAEMFSEPAWRGHPARSAYQAGLACAGALRFCTGKGDSRQFVRTMERLHEGLERLKGLADAEHPWPAGLDKFLSLAHNRVDVGGACENLRFHWLTTSMQAAESASWNEAGVQFGLGFGLDPTIDAR